MRLTSPQSGFMAAEAGLVLAWSSGFIGGALAAETGVIFTVLFWRFVLTSALLLPASGSQLKTLSLKQWISQALIGGLAMFGYLATMIAAIDLGVPAGTAALIAALQPLATAALAGLVLGETVTSKQWTGLAVGFVGVGVTVTGDSSAAPAAGYALALASMVCIVAATLVSKAAHQSVAVKPALAIQSAVSMLLFMPLAAATGGLQPQLSATFWYAVSWFVLLSTLAAYGLYWTVLANTSVTRVSSLIYLTPPVTALWAWLMFGQPITLPALLGFALSLSGVWLARERRTLRSAHSVQQ